MVFPLVMYRCESWTIKKAEKVKIAQSCSTLCNPMDYTVHGILQARILKWVAFPFSRGSSQLRDQTQVSHTESGFFTSWTIREVLKKADHWIIDAFKLWIWRRLLRVPWTVRRSNQSILKEISPEYSLKGLMLKLKLQYFDHLMRRANSWENTWCLEALQAKGEEDDRGGHGYIESLIHWTWIWANSEI